MVLVYVPEDQFEMGSNQDERARPVHTVDVNCIYDWRDITFDDGAAHASFRINHRHERAQNPEPKSPYREVARLESQAQFVLLI
jgi:hypothetical protein